FRGAILIGIVATTLVGLPFFLFSFSPLPFFLLPLFSSFPSFFPPFLSSFSFFLSLFLSSLLFPLFFLPLFSFLLSSPFSPLFPF
ncbi:NCS2 family permease, partial [Streptococcus pyogenes]